MYTRDLINHIESSKLVHHQEDNLQIKVKNSSDDLVLQISAKYPFFVNFNIDYDQKKFKDYVCSYLYQSQSSVNFNISSTGRYYSHLVFPIEFKNMPELLKGSNLILCGSGSKLDKFTGSIGFISRENMRFTTVFNPFMAGFTFNTQKFGAEILYSFEEQQPSGSAYFHDRIKEKIDLSILGSMYGNVSTLVSTYIKKFKFHALFNFNAFSLQSNVSFGLNYEYKNFTLLSAYKLFDNDMTLGFTYKKLFEDKNEDIPGVPEPESRLKKTLISKLGTSKKLKVPFELTLLKYFRLKK